MFLDLFPTGNTKSNMKKKSGQQFTEKEVAEQEEAVKRRAKQKLSIKQASWEKYDQLHDYKAEGMSLILFYYYFY